MIDVLLIMPPVGDAQLYTKSEDKLDTHSYKWKTRITRVPQGLLSIGTFLHNRGYNVDILDCRLHYMNGREHFSNILRERTRNTKLLIGISVMTGQVAQTLKIIDIIRKTNVNVPIVLGGIHPTLFPQQTCQAAGVNFVIAGEGEYPMAELVDALGKGRSYKGIKALTYKENHHVVSNPVGKPFDIRELSVLAYHLLEMENYLPWIPYYREEKTIGIEYLISRGCPYNCSYCVNKILPHNRIYRYKTSNQVIEELHILKNKYKFNYIYFEDDNPFINMNNIHEIAKKFIQDDFNIRYLANVRVDTIVNVPKSILETIRKSGWCETIIGVESGSNNVLGYLRKGFTVEQTLQAAKILNELDIYAIFNTMNCIPNETRNERKQTYALMKKLRQISPKSMFVGPHHYTPYPGSDLYQYCLEEGLVECETFEEWSNFIPQMAHPSDLPWVKGYSYIERLESYFRINYFHIYGLKEFAKLSVKNITRRICNQIKSTSENEW